MSYGYVSEFVSEFDEVLSFFVADNAVFCFNPAIDLESVYHVTRRK